MLLNVVANIILLGYMEEVGFFAGVVPQATLSRAGLAALRNPAHLAHSAGGLVVLLVATVLSVYKPKGLAWFGRRTQRDLAVGPPPIEHGERIASASP